MATKKKPTTKAKTKTTKKTTSKKRVPKTTKKVSTKKTTSKTTKKSVKKPVIKKTTSNKKSVRKLLPLQKIYVFGALLTAVLTGLVAGYASDFNVSITTNYLTENTLTQSGDLIPGMRELFVLNLKYLIVGILVAATVWRAAIASKGFARYSKQVDSKFVINNWLEFGILGPWIIAVIAVAIGIRDVLTLLLLAGSVSFVSLLGYLTDRYNLIGKSTILKTVIITKSLILPWIIIGVSVLHSYLYGFVSFEPQTYAVLVASFVAYFAIAYAHRSQISDSKRANFAFKEQIILWLHMTLLILLAAVAFI